MVVDTVLGPVDPAALGAMSMHEHLLSDLSALVPGATLDDPGLAAREELAGAAGSAPSSTRPCGASAGRAPPLPEISRAAGVHMIAGAGAYLGRTLPSWVHGMSVDALTEHLVACLTAELPGCDFRAGVLGLIGTGHPVAPVEERVLRATAIAAKRTGACVIARVDGRAGGAAPGLEALLADGVPGERIVLSNIDGLHADRARLRELLATGATLKWSLRLRGAAAPGPVVGDRRPAAGRALRPAGDGRHVLACGIWTRAALRAHGGFGYDHLMRAIVPALRERGVDPQPLLVDVPRPLLARRQRIESP